MILKCEFLFIVVIGGVIYKVFIISSLAYNELINYYFLIVSRPLTNLIFFFWVLLILFFLVLLIYFLIHVKVFNDSNFKTVGVEFFMRGKHGEFMIKKNNVLMIKYICGDKNLNSWLRVIKTFLIIN